jgi:aryl-alcohol dehydrogenase-like predicted oxidoreductase
MNPRETVTLGRTDVTVTRLGLGTAPLGGLFSEVADEQAHATLLRAHELGLSFFDTAPLYGLGNAETRLGRALPHLPASTIATKVGRVLDPGHVGDDFAFKGTPDVVPRFDYSAPGVLRSYKESLERLGADRVDVVHIHDPDDHHDQAVNEAFPALARLRADGAISAIGAGMNQTQMLTRFASEADFDCFLVAGRYSLLDRSAADDLFPLCLHKNITVICGGVYNSGVLSGGTTYDYAPAPAKIRQRVRQLEEICGRHGVPLKAAAIQFPLTHPAVTCVVVGARSPEEIEENVRMFEFDVPDALWRDVA